MKTEKIKSGRKTIKIYEYSLEGKFINSYDSISEFRNKYYSKVLGKKPLFNSTVKGVEYHLTNDNTISFKQKVYRDDVLFYITILNSHYCNLQKLGNNKIVQMFNLNDELLAEFKNKYVAAKLMAGKVSKTTIYRQLNKTRANRYYKDLEFKFKYKDE